MDSRRLHVTCVAIRQFTFYGIIHFGRLQSQPNCMDAYKSERRQFSLKAKLPKSFINKSFQA